MDGVCVYIYIYMCVCVCVVVSSGLFWRGCWSSMSFLAFFEVCNDGDFLMIGWILRS